MRKSFLALASVMLLAGAAFAQSQDIPQSDRDLIDFFRGLHGNTPADCPERFAVNRIAENSWHARAFSALRDPNASEAEKTLARKELGDVRDQILLGQSWPIKQHEECSIPYAKAKPVFDGSIDSPAWSGALCFNNEFKLSSTAEEKSGAVWKLMWDENYLYVSARLPDTAIVSNEYGKVKNKNPWDADCLEIFVMPSMRLKAYWEIVITPSNSVFDGLQRNNKTGGFSGNPEEDMDGLKNYAGIITSADGSHKAYIIQAALPFKEMPNYMAGNKPEAGNTIYFTMVRTDDGAKKSLRPLLYDGHNIFGYLKATLVK